MRRDRRLMPGHCFFERGDRLCPIRQLSLPPGERFLYLAKLMIVGFQKLVGAVDQHAAGKSIEGGVGCQAYKVERYAPVIRCQFKFGCVSCHYEFVYSGVTGVSDRPDSRVGVDPLSKKAGVLEELPQEGSKLFESELPNVKWILLGGLVTVDVFVWRRHNEKPVGLEHALGFTD